MYVDVISFFHWSRQDCVEKEYPNRGNICLENGSFLLNFTGCAVCGKRDFMLITNRSLKEEDGEEIVTYDHLCKNCHHVIARHEYTFSIMDEFQEYTMLCMLCGKAEDTISILPDDPRQMTLLFWGSCGSVAAAGGWLPVAQCPGLSHLADSENPLCGFFLCLDLRLFFSLFVVCLQGGCAVELGSFPWLQPEGDFLVSRWAARKYLEQEHPQGLHRSFSEEEMGLLGMLPHSRIQTGTTPKMCQEHCVSPPPPTKKMTMIGVSERSWWLKSPGTRTL